MRGNGEVLPRIHILIVDDSPTDVILTRQAIRNSGVECCVEHVIDGVEALAYLRRESPYGQTARPDLILLDLNMPRKNGLEVLAEIRSDPRLDSLIVVMLSSSDDENDVRTAYDHNVNAYLTKQGKLDQLTDAICHSIEFSSRVRN